MLLHRNAKIQHHKKPAYIRRVQLLVVIADFLDKTDSTFKPLHGAMDTHFHQHHSMGVGGETKHTRVLTKDDEEKLWRSGVMGTRTPKMLPSSWWGKCSAFVVEMNSET